MSHHETKWKANQDKVGFLQKFPGRLTGWDQAKGQTVTTVTPMKSSPGSVVLTFSNNTFAIAGPISSEPRDLSEGIPAIQAYLENRYPKAYAQYMELAQKDKEAALQARLTNIIGAINNNLDDIPELKDHLRSLINEWNS